MKKNTGFKKGNIPWNKGEIPWTKEKTRLYMKQYYSEHREEFLKRYFKNREVANERLKEWRKRNADKIAIARKIYKDKPENKIKHKRYRLRYHKEMMKKNVQYRLAQNLRSRLHSALKNNQKMGSTVRDLSCTISELKFYLEGQFKDEMSWGNWSKKGWHIDHKVPLSSFDLTDRKQFLQAVHYTNLQPLWAKENLSKGDKIL